MIVHITLPEDWAEARRTGRYAVSTRGGRVWGTGGAEADAAARPGLVKLPCRQGYLTVMLA